MDHDTITVTIRLFATFRTNRFRQASRRVSAGTTIADILATLAIPPDEVGVLLRNARHATLDQRLYDHDTVSVFPLVGGG